MAFPTVTMNCIVLYVAALICGSVCLSTAAFSRSLPDALKDFQAPLDELYNAKPKYSLKDIDSLTKKNEKGVNENKEDIGKMATQIQSLQDLLSSLADKMHERPAVVTKQGNDEGNEIESRRGPDDMAAKEVMSLKESIKTLTAQAESSEVNFATLNRTVGVIGNRLKETKDVSGTLLKIEDFVHKQQKRVEQQCLDMERQDSVLLDALSVPTGLENLAFQDAHSSSQYMENEGNYDRNAIDGNRDSNYYHKSCIHTAIELWPWWQGSLKVKSEVHKITITNRDDSYAHRLQNFAIEGFVDDPMEVKNAQSRICKIVQKMISVTETFECYPPIVAKHIRITLQDIWKVPLYFCELEASGHVQPKKRQALAIQSSLASGSSGATMAIDDDPDTCSETQNEASTDPWWQFNLKGKMTVANVRMRNRNDEKYTWLNNLEIRLYDSRPSQCTESRFQTCTSLNTSVGQGEEGTLTCDPPVTGRYLRIVKKGGGVLSLCEVSVNPVS